MGLKSVLRKTANSAITKILKDLTIPVVYHSVGISDYDPSDGDTPSDSGSDHGIDVIFTDFKSSEIDNISVLLIDKKALIPDLSISFTPKTDDYLIEDGVKWEVQGSKTDPVTALHIVHVRHGGPVV